MNITICDDCQMDINEIKTLCQSYAEKNKLSFCITSEINPLNLDLSETDLLFLDIQMPEKCGIDIQRKLELIASKPLIIFVTNYSQYSLESHGINVIGFMEKPVKQEIMDTFLDKGITLLSAGKVISFGNQQYVNTRNIQYIFMEDGYSKASMEDGKSSSGVFKTLKQWEQELVDVHFVRISKSCLVNCQYIKNIQETKVFLKNGSVLTASRREKKNVQDKYMKYLEQTARFYHG